MTETLPAFADAAPYPDFSILEEPAPTPAPTIYEQFAKPFEVPDRSFPDGTLPGAIHPTHPPTNRATSNSTTKFPQGSEPNKGHTDTDQEMTTDTD